MYPFFCTVAVCRCLSSKRDRIQRPHAVALDLFVLFTAAIVPACQKGVVMQFQSHTYGCVERSQVVKLTSVQFGINATINQLDGSFDQCFISWFYVLGRALLRNRNVRQRRQNPHSTRLHNGSVLLQRILNYQEQ